MTRLRTMEIQAIAPDDLERLRRRGDPVDLIDVRTPFEYRRVHAEFARSVPLDGLDPEAVMGSREGGADRPLYAICRSGHRGRLAVERDGPDAGPDALEPGGPGRDASSRHGGSIVKLVIVGGVAGGASAATRARRLSEGARIVVFERGPDVSFANCGLPYYVGGEIAERGKLLVVTPERMRDRYKLDVRVRTSVEAIDRRSKSVRARDHATGRQYDEPYDKLILAPGAAAIRPEVPGIDLPGIFTLRDLRDADRIKERVDGGVERALVVGGGSIGLEMVENLVRRGIATTLVQSRDQVLASFDGEMTTPLVEHLAEHGVEVLLNESVEALERGRQGLEVRLRSGRVLSAGLVIVGVGVRPESSLAVARGEHPQVDVEAILGGPPGRGPFLVDVRSPEEFAGGHIPGAVNISLDDLRDRLSEVPRGREVAAYCQVGQRGQLATRILLQAGFRAANVGGGYQTYRLHRPGSNRPVAH